MITMICFASLCLILFLGSQTTAASPVTDYELTLAAGGTLRLHIVPATWSDAALRCQLDGGVLAYPTTSAILQVMLATMDKHRVPSSGVFIGATDLLSEGDFKILEGGDLDTSLKWAAGEPNNADGAEDCMALTGAGAVADVSCARVLPFFCHKSTYNVPSTNDIAKEVTTEESMGSHNDLLSSTGWDMWGVLPGIASDETSEDNVDFASNDGGYTSTTGLPGRCPRNDYEWEPRTGSCYKLHQDEKSWHQALTTCQEEGGHLAIINSDVESTVLKELYDTMPVTYIIGHIYIGFKKIGDDFATIDGTPLSETGFERWDAYEPSNWGGNEYCGSIHPNGLLNDAPCLIAAFICESPTH